MKNKSLYIFRKVWDDVFRTVDLGEPQSIERLQQRDAALESLMTFIETTLEEGWPVDYVIKQAILFYDGYRGPDLHDRTILLKDF